MVRKSPLKYELRLSMVYKYLHLAVDKSLIEDVRASDEIARFQNTHLRDGQSDFCRGFDIKVTSTPKAFISYLRTSWKPSRAYLERQ